MQHFYLDHFYLDMAVALLGLFACIVGFRRRDRRAGLVFLYMSIGMLCRALERVFPGSSPWLGDIGTGVMLVGSTLYAISVCRTRRGKAPQDAA